MCRWYMLGTRIYNMPSLLLQISPKAYCITGWRFDRACIEEVNWNQRAEKKHCWKEFWTTFIGWVLAEINESPVQLAYGYYIRESVKLV